MQQQVFGWLSIVFCLIGFGLQIHKLLFKKDIKSISLKTFSITVVGSTFWSVHSLFADAFHGGFENAIITFASGVILFCSLRGQKSFVVRVLFCLPIWIMSLTLASMLWTNYLFPEKIYFQDNKIIEMVTGCLAGTLMSISFLPQVVKVIRTKDAIDVSMFMCVFYGLAQVVLIIYWSSRSDLAIGHWLPGVIFCSCVLSFQATLLTLKIIIDKPRWIYVK